MGITRTMRSSMPAVSLRMDPPLPGRVPSLENQGAGDARFPGFVGQGAKLSSCMAASFFMLAALARAVQVHRVPSTEGGGIGPLRPGGHNRRGLNRKVAGGHGAVSTRVMATLRKLASKASMSVQGA